LLVTFEHYAPGTKSPARLFYTIMEKDDTTQRQILGELMTIRKRLGCIGSIMVLVIMPASLYLIVTMAGCHYANYQLNEQIDKLSLPKSIR